MVERSGCNCCSDLPIEEKLCNIKFFHRKTGTFAEEMESKLKQCRKGSKEIINP